MSVIKVDGKGYIATEPDIVKLSFYVETKARDYEECLRTLNARTEDLRQSMEASGLARVQLKTSNFKVRVETKYKNREDIFSGYSASHSMQIELPMENELLNQVLHHVARTHSGANITLSFSVKDMDSLRKKALEQAVMTAREKAETIASAAGVKLGKPIQIYENAGRGIYTEEFSLICSPIDIDNDEIKADIEPANVRAEAEVTIMYQIDE